MEERDITLRITTETPSLPTSVVSSRTTEVWIDGNGECTGTEERRVVVAREEGARLRGGSRDWESDTESEGRDRDEGRTVGGGARGHHDG